jgi:hypothetical protein
MSYNYGRSLFASLVENHIAIIIACAPSVKSVFMSIAFPMIQSVYNSNKSCFSGVWSSQSETTQSQSRTTHCETPENQTPQCGRSSAESVAPSARSLSAISFNTALRLTSPATPDVRKGRYARYSMESMEIECGNYEPSFGSIPNLVNTISSPLDKSTVFRGPSLGYISTV